MNTQHSKRLSHRLSKVLRHGIADTSLTMDTAGWVEIAPLLAHLGITRSELDAVVAQNNKTRFQVEGERVRAAQGHSLDGMPVTRQALEASWEVYDGADEIWHGTNVEAALQIAAEGIQSARRSHVHLAEEVDSRVGKRANVAVLLKVSVARLRDQGIQVFRSPNGVVLVRRVPPDCILGVRAVTRAANARVAELREQFGC